VAVPVQAVLADRILSNLEQHAKTNLFRQPAAAHQIAF
jgi:hypothetical protein